MNILRRCKQVFKGKKKKDPVTLNNFYKLEPLPAKLKMHTILKGRAEEGGFLWEINGTKIEAEDILTAQREYLIQTGQEGEE